MLTANLYIFLATGINSETMNGNRLFRITTTSMEVITANRRSVQLASHKEDDDPKLDKRILKSKIGRRDPADTCLCRNIHYMFCKLLLCRLARNLLIIIKTTFTCYALFFDPLRHIPGPIWARYIPGWLANHALRGEMEESVLKAFKQYGDCVRIGPKTVMLGSPEAVQKVLGHGKNYQVKASDYNVLVVHTPSVFSEIDREKHARKRRIAAHAYSMQSVLKMEIYVRQTTEKFLNQMDLYAKRGVPFDAVKCFKSFAFDVIGNLAYGRDFGMVENDTTAEFATNMERGLQYQFLVSRGGLFKNVRLISL